MPLPVLQMTFVPSQNGDYTLLITDANGCSAMSAVFSMTTVGLQTIFKQAHNVFPNPFNDYLTIELPRAENAVIMTIEGKQLWVVYYIRVGMY